MSSHSREPKPSRAEAALKGRTQCEMDRLVATRLYLRSPFTFEGFCVSNVPIWVCVNRDCVCEEQRNPATRIPGTVRGCFQSHGGVGALWHGDGHLRSPEALCYKMLVSVSAVIILTPNLDPPRGWRALQPPRWELFPGVPNLFEVLRLALRVCSGSSGHI